jgi:hypothetical protein
MNFGIFTMVLTVAAGEHKICYYKNLGVKPLMYSIYART